MFRESEGGVWRVGIDRQASPEKRSSSERRQSKFNSCFHLY
jgi:hypothetical protein